MNELASLRDGTLSDSGFSDVRHIRGDVIDFAVVVKNFQDGVPLFLADGVVCLVDIHKVNPL